MRRNSILSVIAMTLMLATLIASASANAPIIQPADNSNISSTSFTLEINISSYYGGSNGYCNYSLNGTLVSTNIINNAIYYTGSKTLSSGINGEYLDILIECLNATSGDFQSHTHTVFVDNSRPKAPALWTIPSTTPSKYLNVSGFLNEANLNVSISVATGPPDYDNSLYSIISGGASNQLGSMSVRDSVNSGLTQLIVLASDFSNFSSGNYAEFSNHNNTDFKRYNITYLNTGYGASNEALITISPSLLSTVPSGTQIKVYDTESPEGYFIKQVSLYQNKNNTINVWGKDSYGTGSSASTTIFYYLNISLIYTNFVNNLTTVFSTKDIADLTNPFIGIPGAGQINFSGTGINITDYDLDSNIVISNNYIYLNSSNLTNLNVSATITLFNLNYESTPAIYKDGKACTDCTAISYDSSSGKLIFNVTGFSAYTTGNNSALKIGTTGLLLTNRNITFWANYTNITSNASITGASCNITYDNGTIYNMSYSSGLYRHYDTFNSSTTLTYNVTCDHPNFEILNAEDTITIDTAYLPPPILMSLPSFTTNPLLQVIGYTNVSNVIINVFALDSTGDNQNINSSTVADNVTVYGYSSIYEISPNTSIIRVPDASAGIFQVGRYVYFYGHSRQNFYGYNITDVINMSGLQYTRVDITPSLESNITVGEIVWVTNSSKPLGWFNLTLALFPGNNSVEAFINDPWGTSSVNTQNQSVYYDTGMPDNIQNLSLGAFSTSSNYITANWSNASDSITSYYEYSIGTAAYPNPAYNNIYGWNSTTINNFIAGPLSLISNTDYFVNVRAISNSGREGNITTEYITFIDNTGPFISNVSQPLRFTNIDSYIDVEWEAYDNESSINSFDITISKNEYYPLQNSSNIVKQKHVSSGSARSDRVYLNLTHATTYYSYIYGNNDVLSSDTPGFATIGTTYDATPPANISLNYQTGNVQSNKITINVNFGYDDTSGIKKYMLETAKNIYDNGVCQGSASFAYFYEKNISTSSNPKFLNSSGTDNINFTLQSGYCYQFRLKVQNNAGSYSITYSNSSSGGTTLGNVSVDTTPPSIFNVYDTVGSVGEAGLFTLSDNSITVTWDESFDSESGIKRYEVWMTEESYGMGEQPFGNYTEASPLILTSPAIYSPGIYEYVLKNLNLNLSNQTDPTHQFRYRIYIKAVNGVSDFTTSNSDGILYIDNTFPVISLIYVENSSQTSPPYYDMINNGNTTIVIQGEIGMSCVWSLTDEGYKEPINSTYNCTISASGNASCHIPETAEGPHNYYISCKDKNGNKNTALTNLDLTVTQDTIAPVVSVLNPNQTDYSSNIFVEGNTTKYRGNNITFYFNASDFSMQEAWIEIRNSTSNLIVNETITKFKTLGNNNWFNYTWNIIHDKYESYGLTVYANDLFGRIGNDTFSFIYDNTSPTINMLIGSYYNESFNITFNGTNVRSISWNITLTSNLSNLARNGSISFQSLAAAFSNNSFVNISGLSDNNYTLSVWYANDFNDTGELNATFVIDTSPPVINMPVFYLNGDYIFEYNTTMQVLGFNFTAIEFDSENITLDINGTANMTLSEGSKTTLKSYSNITIEVLTIYTIPNPGYTRSNGIIRITNTSEATPYNYNKNTDKIYYDNSTGRLFTGEIFDVSFGIDEISNHSIEYIIHDMGSPSDIHFQGKIYSSVVHNITSAKYNLIKNISTASISLPSGWNLTLNLTIKDRFGNSDSKTYNFTLVTSKVKIESVNFSNNTVLGVGGRYFFKSPFNTSIACANSTQAYIDLMDEDDVLDTAVNKTGSQDINLTAALPSMFAKTSYTLGVGCINQMMDYETDEYTFVFDNETPYLEILNPIASSNNEFYIEEDQNITFNSVSKSVLIYVKDINQTSAKFKVADTSYLTINKSNKTTFYGANGYEIRLLETYVNPYNQNENIASFRVTKLPDSEGTYPASGYNLTINSAGNFSYFSGNLNLPLLYDDLTLNYSQNISILVTLTRLIDSTILLTYDSFNNLTTSQANLGTLYTIPIDETKVNLSDAGDYQLNVTLTDLLNQTTTTTFNFTVGNRVPHFTLPDAFFNNTEVLNKEDYFVKFSATDPDGNDSLIVYGFRSHPNVTLTNFTYTDSSSISHNFIKITPDEDYIGQAWFQLNATDAVGGVNQSMNYTLNITNSSGPLIFNFNTTVLNHVEIGLYQNTSLFAQRVYDADHYNYLPSIKTAIPSNITYNLSRIALMTSTIGDNFAALLENESFDGTNTLNITFNPYNISKINDSLFQNGNYNIHEAFIFDIKNYSKNYTILSEYDSYGISDYNATYFVGIFKLDYNITNDSIDYGSAVLANNLTVSNGFIFGTFSNFSLFVLAEEKPTTEVCGNGVDEDHDGIIATCPPSPPGGNNNKGSSSSSSHSSYGSLLPSCHDGIQNQDETKIDCGGTCGGYYWGGECHDAPRPETCSDGIQNQDETGTDCGGTCSKLCPDEQQPTPFACHDGIQNQDETGTDCGGTCGGYWYNERCNENPLASCYDGIQNNAEEGVDCGGECTTECSSSFFGKIISKINSKIPYGTAGLIAFILMGIIIIGAAMTFVLARKHGHVSEFRMPISPAEEIRPIISEKPEVIVAEPKTEAKTDLDDMIAYIEQEQSRGTLNTTIRSTLKNNGWPKELIEMAMSRTECSKKLKELDAYIKKARASGHSEEKIRHNLLKSEWAEHFVEMVLHEVHEIHDDYDKIIRFSKSMLSKGYRREDVIKALAEVGWNIDEIEPYIAT